MLDKTLLESLRTEALTEAKRSVYSRSFYRFVKEYWHIVDPSEYVDEYYINIVCDHLQAVYDGEIKNLVINIPPRHAKSLIGSVLFNAWVWLTKPEQSFIYATNRQSLTLRDARKTRRLVLSNLYQQINPLSLYSDEGAMSRYTNEKGGSRQSFSMTGNVTGDGADYRFFDDPSDASDSVNPDALDKITEIFQQVFSTRITNPNFQPIVLITQRLALNDLSVYFLNDLGFDHLCLPFRYEKMHPIPIKTTLNFKDWRKKEGALLAHKRWSEKAAQDFEKKLQNNSDGQLQQNPIERKGTVFHIEKHFGEYEDIKTIESITIYADTAESEDPKADFTTLEAWGAFGDSIYLLNELRGQWAHDDILANAKKIFYQFDGKLIGGNLINPKMIIETKSSGLWLLRELQKKNIAAEGRARGITGLSFNAK